MCVCEGLSKGESYRERKERSRDIYLQRDHRESTESVCEGLSKGESYRERIDRSRDRYLQRDQREISTERAETDI